MKMSKTFLLFTVLVALLMALAMGVPRSHRFKGAGAGSGSVSGAFTCSCTCKKADGTVCNTKAKCIAPAGKKTAAAASGYCKTEANGPDGTSCQKACEKKDSECVKGDTAVGACTVPKLF